MFIFKRNHQKNSKGNCQNENENLETVFWFMIPAAALVILLLIVLFGAAVDAVFKKVMFRNFFLFEISFMAALAFAYVITMSAYRANRVIRQIIGFVCIFLGGVSMLGVIISGDFCGVLLLRLKLMKEPLDIQSQSFSILMLFLISVIMLLFFVGILFLKNSLRFFEHKNWINYIVIALGTFFGYLFYADSFVAAVGLPTATYSANMIVGSPSDFQMREIGDVNVFVLLTVCLLVVLNCFLFWCAGHVSRIIRDRRQKVDN